MTKNRVCAYAGETITDEDGQCVVAYVEESEPGYSPTTYRGDIEYVLAVAESINSSLGLTRDDVLNIVSSSMAAGSIQEGESTHDHQRG